MPACQSTHSLHLIDEYASVISPLFIMPCFSGNLSGQLDWMTAHKFQQRNAPSYSDAGRGITSYQPQQCLAPERIWHIGYAPGANSLNPCPLALELWRLLDYNTQLCPRALRIQSLLSISFMSLKWWEISHRAKWNHSEFGWLRRLIKWIVLTKDCEAALPWSICQGGEVSERGGMSGHQSGWCTMTCWA